MFDHLDNLQTSGPGESLPSSMINTFSFLGRPIRLIVQTGIWKPAGLHAALTIRTTFTPPDQPPPYEDDLGLEGMVRYKYRGTDPNQSDNRAMREAMRQNLPLAYFVGIAKGVYVAQYPVWIVGEDTLRHEFTVAVDEGQRYLNLALLDAPQRAYVERLTRSRLHQPVFRARVLHAYGYRCAICRLHHSELLDAAHIIPDGQPDGDPVVPNGLALCKIHHGAYDANLLGIHPDLTVEIAQHLLDETDGPMLLHGLQEMAGTRINLPNQRSAQPEPRRLEYRYEQFRAAS